MVYKIFSFFLLFCTFSLAQLLGPRAAVQELEHDFGKIVKGEKVSYSFYISNSGGDLLKLDNVHASCGCTVAKPEKSDLAPGEGTKINVTFNSEKFLGPEEKSIYVSTNDPNNQMITFKISGVVVQDSSESIDIYKPKISFAETKHDFGKVQQGEIVKYEFGFENIGKVSLQIKDIKTSCGCTAALASSNSLKPGQNGTINVEMNTRNRHGKMTKTIYVFSNDPSSPALLTVTASITKKGS
jgi:Protein of unknown function (DUF1573)